MNKVGFHLNIIQESVTLYKFFYMNGNEWELWDKKIWAQSNENLIYCN